MTSFPSFGGRGAEYSYNDDVTSFNLRTDYNPHVRKRTFGTGKKRRMYINATNGRKI